jgi:enterochelin esterase-like enzyme
MAAAILFAAFLMTQAAAIAQNGTVERIKVHGKSLEGNLSGDTADRDVSVYLPPSYKTDRNRRYPVIYMLHGFTDSDEKWFGFTKHWINLPEVIDKSGEKEMMVVMPNAFTRFQGSMYSDSIVNGDWERYIAQELVAHIDKQYRTIPQAASRGLAGHSMGGYGTLRIGMKYPSVFSSLYALSPCCLVPNMDPQRSQKMVASAAAIRDTTEIGKADFLTKAMLASAAAWSPNPKRPPFYIDLPWQDGAFQPLVAAKWAANAPLAMVDQYIAELRQVKAIAMDAGTKDQPIASTVETLHELLMRYDIPHTSELYDGDHVNRVAERIQTKALPFFAEHLDFSQKKR